MSALCLSKNSSASARVKSSSHNTWFRPRSFGCTKAVDALLIATITLHSFWSHARPFKTCSTDLSVPRVTLRLTSTKMVGTQRSLPVFLQ